MVQNDNPTNEPIHANETVDTPETINQDDVQSNEQVEQEDVATDAVVDDNATDGQADEEDSQAIINELNHTIVRLRAEQLNMQKRFASEQQKAIRFAHQSVMADLLAVADSAEKGMEMINAIDDSNEQKASLLEGVELIYKSLLHVFEQQHVVQFNPEGESFDPEKHQAMSTVENSEIDPNIVVRVFQKGYLIHDRLLRPALVSVSKKPKSSEA